MVEQLGIRLLILRVVSDTKLVVDSVYNIIYIIYILYFNIAY